MQIPYFDDLQARQDLRQSVIDKDLEDLQQVPNTWIYRSSAELEQLRQDYVASLIEKGELLPSQEVEEIPYIEGNIRNNSS
jgi:hypothetical protein